MNNKTISKLLLSIIFLILIILAIIFLVPFKKDPYKKEIKEYSLLNFKGIKKIINKSINHGNNDSNYNWIVEKDELGWNIKYPNLYKADKTIINKIIKNLKNIKYTDKINIKNSKISKSDLKSIYGIGKNTSYIITDLNSKDIIFNKGNITLDNEFVYVSKADNKYIYLTTKDYASKIKDYTLDDIRSREIISLNDNNILSIDISKYEYQQNNLIFKIKVTPSDRLIYKLKNSSKNNIKEWSEIFKSLLKSNIITKNEFLSKNNFNKSISISPHVQHLTFSKILKHLNENQEKLTFNLDNYKDVFKSIQSSLYQGKFWETYTINHIDNLVDIHNSISNIVTSILKISIADLKPLTIKNNIIKECERINFNINLKKGISIKALDTKLFKNVKNISFDIIQSSKTNNSTSSPVYVTNILIKDKVYKEIYLVDKVINL